MTLGANTCAQIDREFLDDADSFLADALSDVRWDGPPSNGDALAFGRRVLNRLHAFRRAKSAVIASRFAQARADEQARECDEDPERFGFERQ